MSAGQQQSLAAPPGVATPGEDESSGTPAHSFDGMDDDEEEEDEEDDEEAFMEGKEHRSNGVGGAGVRRAVSMVGEGGGGLVPVPAGGGVGGYWSMRQSRPSSPRMPPPEQDPAAGGSSSICRPRSRHDLHQLQPIVHQAPSSRYNNLGYWRARRVTFYRNGDPYFPGVEFRSVLLLFYPLLPSYHGTVPITYWRARERELASSVSRSNFFIFQFDWREFFDFFSLRILLKLRVVVARPSVAAKGSLNFVLIVFMAVFRGNQQFNDAH